MADGSYLDFSVISRLNFLDQNFVPLLVFSRRGTIATRLRIRFLSTTIMERFVRY